MRGGINEDAGAVWDDTGDAEFEGFGTTRSLAASGAVHSLPTPAPVPDTLDCTAVVSPETAPPPVGVCVSIRACLAAIPASCTTKTLHLKAGRYSGPQNTRIELNGTASVAIVGPAAPVPLRVSPNGVAEVDDMAKAASAAATVAVIDGEHHAWIFAVGGRAELRLENVTLARGQAGQFPMGEGMVVGGDGIMMVSGGGALRVTESGAVNISGVLFDSNTAISHGLSGNWGGALFTSSDGAALVDGCVFRNNTAAGNFGDGGAVHIRHLPTTAGSAVSVAPVFQQCLFEGNSALKHGGGAYVADAVPRFSGCTWRHDTSLRGGGVYIESIFEANITAVAPVFKQCLFESCSVTNKGGGVYVLEAVPRFRGCIWRSNKARARGGALAVHSSGAGTAAIVVPNFDDCLFEANTAAHDGGGVCYKDTAPRMRNCTFRGNKVSSLLARVIFFCSPTSCPRRPFPFFFLLCVPSAHLQPAHHRRRAPAGPCFCARVSRRTSSQSLSSMLPSLATALGLSAVAAPWRRMRPSRMRRRTLHSRRARAAALAASSLPTAPPHLPTSTAPFASGSRA